jgi:hypothetical protein
MGNNMNAIKKSTEASVVANKVVCLEVNPE